MNNHATLALIFVPAFSGWLIPRALNHHRSGWAIVSLITTALALGIFVLLPGQVSASEPLIIAVAALFSLLGLIAICVGFHDKRRVAPWLIAALFALISNTLWTSKISLSLMIILSLIAALVAWFHRKDASTNADQLPALAANNRTRRAGSLPRKFVREGAFHWLPIYAVVRLSDLAREGIERSGSYRFADHIYRNIPSGRTVIGRWIDARFLASAASRAFRQRNSESSRVLETVCDSTLTHPANRDVRILAVPCGLPRDLTSLIARRPDLATRIDYHGLDIDPELLALAKEFTAPTETAGVKPTFHQGNALTISDYPRKDFDVIVSMGLGEFLTDAQLAVFYHNAHASLASGGRFFTSATGREASSEAFLKAFELDTNYRTQSDLTHALASARQSWSRVEFTTDETGLQTFVVATK